MTSFVRPAIYLVAIEEGDLFGVGNYSRVCETKDTPSSRFFGHQFPEPRGQFSECEKSGRNDHHEHRRYL